MSSPKLNGMHKSNSSTKDSLMIHTIARVIAVDAKVAIRNDCVAIVATN